MALLFLPLALLAGGFVFYVFQNAVFAGGVGVGIAIWLLASYYRANRVLQSRDETRYQRSQGQLKSSIETDI